MLDKGITLGAEELAIESPERHPQVQLARQLFGKRITAYALHTDLRE